jgi:sarcosine oxidase subunit alpha
MCSTGQCGWCECEVDGVPSVRTCRMPIVAGMVVRGEHALPSVRYDVLALLGVGSRLVPPTFYHHRFLRPRRLRKAYLDVIRGFGGRGRLRSRSKRWAAARVAREAEVDVLIVGAGPSGLAAAHAATEGGARVLVLEADAARGEAGAAASGGEPGSATSGLDVHYGTAAVGWYDGVVAAVDAEATWEIMASAVIAATGSYERLPLVPGADRPGVMAARLVRRLVEDDRVLPGRRALLLGAGPELEAAGAALRGAGAGTSGPVPAGAIVRIEGRRGVRAVRVRSDRGVQRVSADLVVVGDRVPALDLLLAAGADVEWHEDHLVPALDADGRTTVPGVWAAGGAAGRSGDLEAARRAGRAAAKHARSRTAASEPSRNGHNGNAAARADGTDARAGNARVGNPQAMPPDALACFCEDVHVREIADEVDAGYGDPELLKRRTGALTGPCQGKYGLAAVACAARSTDGWVTPTSRPPLRPVRLGELAGPHPLAGEQEAARR